MEKRNEEATILNSLIEAFPSNSTDQVKIAYEKAGGDPGRTAEILLSSPAREKSSIKKKKVVVCSGLVSNVVRKEERRKKKMEFDRFKDDRKPPYSESEAEEFLCSMLGGSCDLDPAVVKDVFGHSGYDIEKALDALLDLCDSSGNRFTEISDADNEKIGQNKRSIHATSNEGNINSKVQPRHRNLDSQSHTSDLKAVHELSMRHNHWDGARRRSASDVESLIEYDRGGAKLNLQQDVLDSLFNVPNISIQESGSMNWKKALKNVENSAQGLEHNPTSNSPQNDEGASYDDIRSTAGQHWGTMKSFYQRAAVAYAKGDRAHASYLSEKGNTYRKLAQIADEKASQEIFEARNKDIQNTVTIDLHGQHVKEAIKLLKVHLLLLNYVLSIKFLKVITGCGTHSVGKGRLKQSVTGLLRKEGITWSEENSGTLMIEIDRSKKYNFMDVDSDDGSD